MYYGQTIATWVTPTLGKQAATTALRLGWSTSTLLRWSLEQALPKAEKMAKALEAEARKAP